MDKEKNKDIDDVTFEDQHHTTSDENTNSEDDHQSGTGHEKETKRSKRSKTEKVIEELVKKCEESND